METNPCALVLLSVAGVNVAAVRRVDEVALGSLIDSVCHCRVEKSLQSYMRAAAIPPQRHWNQRSRCAPTRHIVCASRKSVLCGRGFFNDTKVLLSQLTIMDEEQSSFQSARFPTISFHHLFVQISASSRRICTHPWFSLLITDAYNFFFFYSHETLQSTLKRKYWLSSRWEQRGDLCCDQRGPMFLHVFGYVPVIIPAFISKLSWNMS